MEASPSRPRFLGGNNASTVAGGFHSHQNIFAMILMKHGDTYDPLKITSAQYLELIRVLDDFALP